MEKLYYDPSHPASLGGVKRLQKGIESKKKAEEWLSSQRAYTLHRPIRRKFPTRSTRTSHFGGQWQADLNEMHTYSRENKGYQYILTVIDIFSRYAWAEPLKTKKSADVIKAFKNILKTTKPPHLLQTDRGKEFENKAFQQFMQQNSVKWFAVTSSVKASLCERFNRTLKTRMFRYFTHRGSYKWVDVLKDLVRSYNQSIHRSLPKGMTPEKASEVKNQGVVWEHQEKAVGVKAARYSIGDGVRISKHKGTFAKGYLPNWSEEIFSITEVDTRFQPPMYTIQDEQGNKIKGKFYEQELQKVSNPNKMYAIEKIIRRRGSKYLVKFLGYPGNYWVDAVYKQS
jgi:transposase InsO family protein